VIECQDLIDRIGENFDLNTKPMALQAEHLDQQWAEDDYTSVTVTVTDASRRTGGEGEAVLEALYDKTDFMYGKTDGKVRMKEHDVKELLRTGRIKKRSVVLKRPAMRHYQDGDESASDKTWCLGIQQD
jgi:hypothetical protein